MAISCSQVDRSINVYSYTIKDPGKKQRLLKEYVGKQTGILDAEYHIVYRDNSSGFGPPGPSDHYIKLALEIHPDSLQSWYSELTPLKEIVPLDYWKDLKLDRNTWEFNTYQKAYSNKSKTELKVIFRGENRILAIYSSNPISTLIN